MHMRGAEPEVQKMCKYDVQPRGAIKRRNREVQIRDETEKCN